MGREAPPPCPCPSKATRSSATARPPPSSAATARSTGCACFERLVGLANDVGLLAEEYDPAAGRLVGNFPQAFSHIALVNTARNVSSPDEGPAEHRLRG
ncbi:MAG TPA: glycoside hydrolase family 15 protein [Polyangiaceae bacterium]|nr:glycoside hydrolase family 15 protein [Polyangiaceae bacterium]